jgi:hypothetical protein
MTESRYSASDPEDSEEDKILPSGTDWKVPPKALNFKGDRRLPHQTYCKFMAPTLARLWS